MRQRVGFYLGLIFFLLFLILPSINPEYIMLNRGIAITLLIAVWWITEAIPIPVTALLPLILFPLLGIMSGKSVAVLYMNSNIFLFMGGFIIALALEKWGLHRRIALNILNLLGDKPARVILGFMLATGFLSMWISNTATTMLMVPIALSVAKQVGTKHSQPLENGFGLSLMLAIAYAANIGGIATLIGTPPNIVFSQIFRISFPDGPEISFLQWMLFAFPLSAIFIFLCWLLLTRILIKLPSEDLVGGRGYIEKELQALGPMSQAERKVLLLFTITALLWIFRKDIPLGIMTIPGWSSLLGLGKYVDDGTVSILMAVLLFIIPASQGKSRLMDWETAVKLPWGIIILFGGGFALAGGLKSSEVNTWIGQQFNNLQGTPPLLLSLLSSTILTFLTEITSNTATAQMALPIFSSIAAGIKVNPFLLMLPATISASFAFMLPVATPPNAIVFGTGYIPIKKMVQFGLVLNLIGILLVNLIIYTIAIPVLHISLTTIPSWMH